MRKRHIGHFLIVIMIISAFMLSACGKKQTTAGDANNENKDTNTIEGADIEAVEEEPAQSKETTFVFPNMDYDAWLTDSEGNKLFGYNTPLGFVKNEERSKCWMAVYARGGEVEYEEEFDIYCFEDKEGKWQEWYEKGIANVDAYDSDNTTVIENGVIETPYGEFKDYILDDNRENYADREIAILYLPSGYGVEIEIGITGWAYEGSMSHLLNILTGEKQEKIEISDSYENYLYTENGEKILGFYIPEGYKLSSSSTEESIDMGNGAASISIYEYNPVTKVYEENEEQLLLGYQQNGDPIYNYYDYKDETDTIYGTVKFYERKTDSFDIIEELGILRVNGRYIVVSYFNYENEEYSGNLKEIIETQLF